MKTHTHVASEHNSGMTQFLSETSITPPRHRLEDTRNSITHKFNVSGQEGYLIVGLYENGKPGELFIKMAKEGSTLGGLADTIGILTSLCLQHGVPVETLASKLCDTKFEPAGNTNNTNIPEHLALATIFSAGWEITSAKAENALGKQRIKPTKCVHTRTQRRGTRK